MTMAKGLRVSVDHNKCVGSTMCVQTTPSVFVLDEKGQSTVVDPDGDTEARIIEAAEQCPVSAIIVEDAETGRRLFP
ncbi:MAG: ferredoxin [Acidimicrobiia bacterium]